VSFLYESYIKCGSTKKYWRKFCSKFPGTIVQAQEASMNLLRKSGPWVTSRQESFKKTWCAYRLKVDEIWAKLEHTSQKSPRCLAQETGISKSSAAKATKLLKR
jgi:hypothetical protein